MPSSFCIKKDSRDKERKTREPLTVRWMMHETETN